MSLSFNETIIPPNAAEYLCVPQNTTLKAVIIYSTGGVAVTFYTVLLVLGIFNSYHILVKQRYYKSMFLTLQYVFGILISAVRIVSTLLILTVLA